MPFTPLDCVTKHTAVIYDRGGKRRITQLVNLSNVDWARQLSTISAAQVDIAAENCSNQVDALDQIEPKRHELVLFRGEERVWEGPIRRVNWARTGVTVQAGDGLDYLDATPLTKDWPGPDGGGPPLMTDRVSEIINYELTTPYTMETNQGVVTVPRWETITTPANLLPYLNVQAGEVPTTAATTAFQMSLYDHLSALASESALDFTMIGRQLVIWDSSNSIGKIKTLTETDFVGDLEVFEDGTDHFDVSHVSANQQMDGSDPLIGHAGGEDSYYGVWEQIMSSSSTSGTGTTTQSGLNGQAQGNLTGRTPVPLYLRVPDSSGIYLSDDLTINQLVPGVQVPVLAKMNLKQVSQVQRLSMVRVTETGTGENVVISLTTKGVAS